MGILTATYIDSLIKAELGPRALGTNHDIYDKRQTARYPWEPFQKVPYAIYFYYVEIQADGRPRVDHYFYNNGPLDNAGSGQPIPNDKVEPVIAMLAQNARSTGLKNPPIDGNNFKDVTWQRISYIVILVDEEHWDFQQRSNGDSAIVFNVSKGSTPNHSFFDARDVSVQIPVAGGGFDTRSAVLFINHLKKNSDGETLMGAPSQQFYFDAYVDVIYAGASNGPLKVILDPGGTNQGPPIEP